MAHHPFDDSPSHPGEGQSSNEQAWGQAPLNGYKTHGYGDFASASSGITFSSDDALPLDDVASEQHALTNNDLAFPEPQHSTPLWQVALAGLAIVVGIAVLPLPVLKLGTLGVLPAVMLSVALLGPATWWFYNEYRANQAAKDPNALPEIVDQHWTPIATLCAGAVFAGTALTFTLPAVTADADEQVALTTSSLSIKSPAPKPKSTTASVEPVAPVIETVEETVEETVDETVTETTEQTTAETSEETTESSTSSPTTTSTSTPSIPRSSATSIPRNPSVPSQPTHPNNPPTNRYPKTSPTPPASSNLNPEYGRG
ncbi:hypothetical protein [Corynebacterium sp. H78]|uniref:hypothetical protein n=1 Tax=Corynebacterium sp. H78 TaxID=3133417 RepID=UPI00309751CE